MGQPVDITTSDVPTGFCFTDWRTAWAFLVSLISAEVSGSASFFNFGATTPAPDDRDKPWLRLNADGTDDRDYVYANGAWVSRHPIAPGLGMLWWGNEADIPTLDGGEAGTITATTGPMWVKKSEMDAKIPIGPGTLPSTRAIAVNGTLGEEKHTLTREELPDEAIETISQRRTNVQDGGSAVVTTPETAPTGAAFTNIPLPTEPLGDGEAHENMPPVYGTFFIVRSARTHYRL